MADPQSEDEVAALVALLDVETIEPDLYRGPRYPRGRGRVFGGQVIGQALVAGARSASPSQQAHSLHAYFMRPGDEDLEIDYRVLKDFDGRSFATRRIVALQNDAPILTMTASFQRSEAGFEHGAPMPDVPGPDALDPGDKDGGGSPVMAHFLKRFGAFEFRPIPPFGELAPRPQPGPSRLWFRLAGAAPADPAMRSAMLAYLSDFGLLTTAVLPHGVPLFSGKLQAASLDHSLWLHEPPAFDQWILYTMESPWAGGGRGLTRGTFHTQDGRHIASVAQEGLIRPIERS
ncbi:MAG TPA: acyl-CoA thioesterase domain-containing protein [Sphingomonas sp.]|uniref:acyl-CoA thioesterase n=1 Tax=Sphingomonas sp. TaxID=28214 RepID=UPI002B8CAED4|nr:acyl-CoA thioesterase domain-containing protein [Sphingomonas sp.]HMI18663.1 acyl-CoA thioesterase domain-containing protein [Sphingomonas sp.]